MIMHTIYLVKDLSRLSGLSVYTVKYYLNLGLIKEIGRSPESNFRYFDDSTLEQISAIIRYKREGMSLAKIKNVITGSSGR